jgi:hypothetical protein
MKKHALLIGISYLALFSCAGPADLWTNHYEDPNYFNPDMANPLAMQKATSSEDQPYSPEDYERIWGGSGMNNDIIGIQDPYSLPRSSRFNYGLSSTMFWGFNSQWGNGMNFYNPYDPFNYHYGNWYGMDNGFGYNPWSNPWGNPYYNPWGNPYYTPYNNGWNSYGWNSYGYGWNNPWSYWGGNTWNNGWTATPPNTKPGINKGRSPRPSRYSSTSGYSSSGGRTYIPTNNQTPVPGTVDQGTSIEGRRSNQGTTSTSHSDIDQRLPEQTDRSRNGYLPPRTNTPSTTTERTNRIKDRGKASPKSTVPSTTNTRFNQSSPSSFNRSNSNFGNNFDAGRSSSPSMQSSPARSSSNSSSSSSTTSGRRR